MTPAIAALAAALEGELDRAPLAEARALWGDDARAVLIARACATVAIDELGEALGVPRGQGWWRAKAIARARREVAAHLQDVRPPDGPRDVVGELIQAIVPARLRRRFGEVYTPVWLAEQVLDAAGYDGGPVVDPTCGSGVFLVCAAWRGARELAGADLSPLAVRATTINLRLAGIARPKIILADAIREAPLPPSRWVVGNPPWVRWTRLPAAYRAQVAEVAAAYGMRPKGRFGGTELDVAGLVVYRAADRWLAPGGRLAMLVTQSLLQSPASSGFRTFELPDGTPLGVHGVDDWTAIRAFDAAGARAATLILDKGRATRYPVPYRVHTTVAVEAKEAHPIGPDRRWAITRRGERALLDAIAGADPHHQGRKGITCDLNGAYFVRVLARRGALLEVEAVPSRTPVPVDRFTIEQELVYPLLKGAGEVRAFEAGGDLAAIVPNADITTFAQLPPHAARHFSRLRTLLEARSTWRTRMPGAPYWAIYNVGPYTFAPWKVVWAEQAKGLAAAVVGAREVTGTARPVVPDHKIYFVPFDDPAPAHYLCALLNAPCVRHAIDAFTVKLQVGTIFQHVRLPRFDPRNPTHRALADTRDPARLDALARQLLG